MLSRGWKHWLGNARIAFFPLCRNSAVRQSLLLRTSTFGVGIECRLSVCDDRFDRLASFAWPGACSSSPQYQSSLRDKNFDDLRHSVMFLAIGLTRG